MGRDIHQIIHLIQINIKFAENFELNYSHFYSEDIKGIKFEIYLSKTFKDNTDSQNPIYREWDII